jgi:hypothetical protein
LESACYVEAVDAMEEHEKGVEDGKNEVEKKEKRLVTDGRLGWIPTAAAAASRV